MAKLKCTEPRKGVKTCKITEHGKTRSVRLHDHATAGTKAKRRAAARRLKSYRFTKADARACGKFKSPKARGNCMGNRVEARA
jgi:hypothetical protein